MVDSQGRKWEVMEREDGSVVCYYTREGDSAHWVVWDSLDRRPTPRAVDLATDTHCPECNSRLTWCAECEKHITPLATNAIR